MIEYLPLVLTGIGLTASILYYASILRNANKTQQMQLETRQLQLYMQILNKLQNPEMIKQYINVVYNQEYSNYEEWRDKYGPRVDPDAYSDYNYLTAVYQNIGYLVKSGVIDVETLAEQERPQSFVTLWKKIEPIVSYHRNQFNPEAYASLEYLCKEMERLLEQRKQ